MPEMYLPKATDWINAYEAGDQQRQARQKMTGAKQAGALLGAGDYAGAAGAAYGGGDLQTGVAIANMGRQHEADVANMDDAKRERMQKSVKTAYSIFKTVKTQEDLDRLKMDPQVQALVPDIGTADLAKIQQVVSIGDQLFPEETTVVGNSLVGKSSHTALYSAPKEYKPDWRERSRADGSTEWFDINGEGAPQGSAAPDMPPSAPSPSTGSPDAFVSQLTAQGARVTSGVRSPADNARVGGVSNSYHLAANGGSARDLVPPPGVPMSAFAQQVRQSVPAGYEAIPEGDHVHIEPKGPPPSRVAPSRSTIRGDAPKSKEQAPPSGYQWGADGSLSAIRGGPGDPSAQLDKAPTEFLSKAINFSYRTLQANKRMTELVDRGIVKPRTATAQLFEADKNGAVRMITKSNEDRQFMQAAKEWLAPVLRKDSGAAVSDGELQTYMDIYIPRFEDDAQTIRQKAAARKDAMIALVGETGGRYERQYGKPKFDVSFVPPKQGIRNRPALAKIFGG